MFSVPGWSLSAPLKTQNQILRLSSLPAENGTIAPPPSKRRKRDHAKSKTPLVTADNVVELWETHIEGKKPSIVVPDKSKAQGGRKKRKHEDGLGTDGAPKAAAFAGSSKLDGREAVSSEDSKTPQNPETKRRNEKKKKKKEKERKQRELQEQKDSGQPSTGTTLKKVKITKPAESGNEKPAILPSPSSTVPSKQTASHPAPTLTPLQASMRAKLASARFRHLNQTLYTSPSTEALDLFTKNPEMYSEYHAGFRQQVEIWPENPVDGYISLIKLRGRAKLNKKGEIKGHKPVESDSKDEQKLLPRTQGSCTIADLGCGDARLSHTLQPVLKSMQMKVLSFDLHSDSPLVKKADISALPLADGSVNVVLFCLALMGTNWTDFIDEAWRILHWKGELWIAEIKSRFARGSKEKVVEHSVGKKKKKPSQMSEAQRGKAELEQKQEDDALAIEVDGVENAKGETDIAPFVQVLRRRGFLLDSSDHDSGVDLSNKMFVRMRFVKAVAPAKGKNVEAATLASGHMPETKVKTTFRGKYVRTDPDEKEMDESAVLKPCVYKLR